MYHENKQQIHWGIFITCTLFALISPSYNTTIAQAETGKTNTGKVETRLDAPVSSTGEVDRKEKTDSKVDSKWSWVDKLTQGTCWVDCKIKHLVDIWIDKKLAQPLVENCKRIATDARHCIIAGASVITAESGWKLKNCYHKNCTWLWAGKIWYETYEAGIIDWIIRYQKYWYKAKSASFFYPSVGEKSKSRYCTSEHSSWSAVGCPNGQKSAQSTWNKLSKLF